MPIINNFLIAPMNHLAGVMLEINCSINGMFSMGNIIPDKIRVGIMKTKPEISKAASCVLTIVETKSPKEMDTVVYKRLRKTIQNKDPFIGTPITKCPITKTVIKLMQERIK